MADEDQKYRTPEDRRRPQSLDLGAGAPAVDNVAVEAMRESDRSTPTDDENDGHSRGRRPILQPALRVIAEAGWITVVYAALSVILSHDEPILGPAELIGFVLAGAFVAWIGRPRPELGALLLIVAVVVGGAIGWLANPEVRALLPNLPAAFNVHLAGWFAGVAVLRGAVINTGDKAAEEIERLLRSVPIALALIWAYVSIAAVPSLWLSFAILALWGTVMFLASAIVSIGIARLNILHADVIDQRQRRGWRWLVVAIGFGIVPIAIPIGILAGIPLGAILTPAVGPLQFLVGLAVIPLSWIVWLLSEILRPIGGPLGQFLDELEKRLNARPQPTPQEPNELGTLIGLAMWIFTIFVVLLAVFLVARWLLRRKEFKDVELDPAAAEISRAIVIPPQLQKQAAVRARRRGAPHDAVAAYMSTLAELEAHPDLSRRPNETPADHAARVRTTEPSVADDFVRLAVDYQLARYGEVRITQPENVRAVTRYQKLRRILRSAGA